VAKTDRKLELQKDAWIGDAVLSLYARLRILDEDQALDGEKFARMTSNQYLSLLGEPTATEAAIGRAYREGGLDRAFAWMDTHLLPLFERMEANRLKRLGKVPATRQQAVRSEQAATIASGPGAR
jgi:dsRNA-specific ribonuclease